MRKLRKKSYTQLHINVDAKSERTKQGAYVWAGRTARLLFVFGILGVAASSFAATPEVIELNSFDSNKPATAQARGFNKKLKDKANQTSKASLKNVGGSNVESSEKKELRRLLEERKKAVVAAIQTTPDQVDKLALPPEVQTTIPDDLKGEVEQKVSQTGLYSIGQAHEGKDYTPTSKHLHVTSEDGKTMLRVFGKNIPVIPNGTRVNIEGTAIGSQVALNGGGTAASLKENLLSTLMPKAHAQIFGSIWCINNSECINLPAPKSLNDYNVRPATDAAAKKRLLIVPVNFENDRSVPINSATNKPITLDEISNFFGASPDSVKNRFKIMSYGKLNLEVRRTDWITLKASNSMGDCAKQPYGPFETWRNEIRDQLIRRNLLGNTTNVIYVINRTMCTDPMTNGVAPVSPMSGFSSMYDNNPDFIGESTLYLHNANLFYPEGWTGKVDPGYLSVIMAHEFGHALSLNHANGGCFAQGQNDTQAKCAGSSEYKDPYDNMGTGSHIRAAHFNAVYKRVLGWLRDDQIRDIYTSGKYSLPAMASGGAVAALRIPTSGSPVSPRGALYLEFRPAGIDWVDNFTKSNGGGEPETSPGLLVREVDLDHLSATGSISGRATALLNGSDRNGEWDYHFASLVSGQTYRYHPVGLKKEDVSSDVCIRLDSTSGDMAYMTIELKCATNELKPFTSLGSFSNWGSYLGAQYPLGLAASDGTSSTEPSYLTLPWSSCSIRDNVYIADSNRVIRYNVKNDISNPWTNPYGQADYTPSYLRASNVLGGTNPNKITDLYSIYNRSMDNHFRNLYKEGYKNGLTGRTDTIKTSFTNIACDPDRNLVFVADYLSPSLYNPTTISNPPKTGGKILVFDVTSIQSGQKPIAVLGQDKLSYTITKPSSSSTDTLNAYTMQQLFKRPAPARNAASFYEPKGLSYDSSKKRLYVNELYSTRVFDLSGGVSTGMSAKYVLGQSTFEASTNYATTTVNGTTYDLASASKYSFDQKTGRAFTVAPRSGVSNSYTILVYNTNQLSNGAQPILALPVIAGEAATAYYDSLTDQLIVVTGRSRKVYIYNALPNVLKSTSVPARVFTTSTGGTLAGTFGWSDYNQSTKILSTGLRNNISKPEQRFIITPTFYRIPTLVQEFSYTNR